MQLLMIDNQKCKKPTLKLVIFDDLASLFSICAQSCALFISDTLKTVLSGSEIAGSTNLNVPCCHKSTTKLLGCSTNIGGSDLNTLTFTEILVQNWLSV